MNIAIYNPSGRIDKMTKPFDKVGISYTINPKNIFKYDIILLDIPDKNLFLQLIKGKVTKTPIIYRMRGDVFKVLSYDETGSIKHYIALNYVLKYLDGIIAVNKVTEEIVKDNYPNMFTTAIQLPINSNKWPKIKHKHKKLRFITLTNVYYRPKIKPLIKYAYNINKWLIKNNSVWYIYGNNDKYNTDITSKLNSYSNINFKGETDKVKDKIKQSNAMIHITGQDAFPNAVLEGLASNLPVITNNFKAFTSINSPVISISPNEVNETFNKLKNPNYREHLGNKGIKYVKKHNNTEKIGEEYKNYFKEVLK